MLNLLTATGERPEAFALCERWMQRQTYAGDVRWIIVDDGRRPTPITFRREGWSLNVIRPEPLWQPGQNTQARNLLRGLAVIDGPTVIIEDDDWYAPEWLERISVALDLAEVVGQRNAVYYNVSTGIRKHCRNVHHASLCATAVRDGGLQRLREVCNTSEKFIDVHLWKHPDRHLFDANLVVGMKGLPGRENIGIGKSLTGDRDPDRAILRELIGDDADLY